jgi:hypothetical protein
MISNIATKEDIQALAEASNELCVAIEIAKIRQPDWETDFSCKNLLKRKDELWAILAKFGY